MKKLPQLTQSTRMLVCGEDLGMIPDCVASVMNDLRILSLEIQRMPKNPLHEFGHLSEYPYRSVCTISTHDMSTLRGWWEEDYQQTQRYYNTILGHYGIAPTVATPELCEEVVRNHLNSKTGCRLTENGEIPMCRKNGSTYRRTREITGDIECISHWNN